MQLYASEIATVEVVVYPMVDEESVDPMAVVADGVAELAASCFMPTITKETIGDQNHFVVEMRSVLVVEETFNEV